MQAAVPVDAPAPVPAPTTPPRFVPTKAQAFAIHVVLSLLVFSTLVATMVLWWFPGELFFLDGGWQGLKLVAMVDLVLGPALTLLLYKPGKPKLVLDMTLIAIVQLAALGYGFVTTYQQRTVAVVHAEKTFGTVSASDARAAAAALRDADIEPGSIPALVAASSAPGASAPVPMLMTPDPAPGEFGQYLAELLNGLPELRERSDRYVVLGDAATVPASSALALETLASGGEREAVEAALASASLDIDEVELHRFRARYAKGIAIWDPASARILDYVPEPERAADAAETPTETAEGGEEG